MNDNVDWYSPQSSLMKERVRMGVKASNRILTRGELKKIWDSLVPTSLNSSQRKIWFKHVEELIDSYQSWVCTLIHIKPSEFEYERFEVY